MEHQKLTENLNLPPLLTHLRKIAIQEEDLNRWAKERPNNTLRIDGREYSPEELRYYVSKYNFLDKCRYFDQAEPCEGTAGNQREGYWLILDPHTFTARDQHQVLIYNSRNGVPIEYSLKDPISRLIERSMENEDSVTFIDKTMVEGCNIDYFRSKLRQYYSGDLVDSSLNLETLIIPLPTLNPLLELNVHVNSIGGSGGTLKDGVRQFNYPSSSGGNIALGSCLDFIPKASSPKHLNIIFGEFSAYTHFSDLIHQLLSRKLTATMCMRLEDLLRKSTNFDLLQSHPLPVSVWVGENFDEKAILNLNQQLDPLKFVFILQSNSQLERVNHLVTKYGLPNHTLEYYFNGDNLQFFSEAVFWLRGDIFDFKPYYDQIIRRETINPSQYGRLTILPSGDIYTSVNQSPIGHIGKDSFEDLLSSEALKNSTWFRLRQEVEPCRLCLFNRLCPPLTDMEYTLCRNNLCHVLNG